MILSLSLSVAAWETPQQAISEYLEFELNGGRLSSKLWNMYISKYVHVPEVYDEPGWDMATVIDTCKIGDINCVSTSACTAKVIFTLYPTAKLDGLWVFEHKTGGIATALYPLVKKNNDWRVEPADSKTPGQGAPIISIETYRSHQNRLNP